MGSSDGTPPGQAAGKAQAEAPEQPATTNEGSTARPATSHGQSSRRSSVLLPRDGSPRPALPPRPSAAAIDLIHRPPRSRSNTLQLPRRASRPQLVASATTALYTADIESHSHANKQVAYAHSVGSTPSRKSLHAASSRGNLRSYQGSDVDDNASILSSVLRTGLGIDAESILGDVLVTDQSSTAGGLDGPAQKELGDMLPYDMSEPTADFNREFDELESLDADGNSEGRPTPSTTTPLS